MPSVSKTCLQTSLMANAIFFIQYEEVQRVLRDEIVNPLRQRLFVRADRVLALR